MCAAVGVRTYSMVIPCSRRYANWSLRAAPPEAEQTARGIAVAAEMEQANDASEPALRQASGVESGSPLTQPADSSAAQTVAEEAQHGVPPAPAMPSSHTRRRGTVRQGAASRGTAS